MDRVDSRILVVDDNAENRALARATLEDEGMTVILATSGDEAIAEFEAARPDCVLLDVRMPGADGFEVCARIRRLPGGEDTPVLFFTALRDIDTFDRALRAGGDDFITKPVRPTELVVRVNAALKLRRMSAELRESFELVRRQRDDLMRLQLQKERLSAFVLHDLKNPVHSMLMHAELLLDDPAIGEDARDSGYCIRESASSLLRLVLDLLDISKSEEGHLVARKAPVDLQALVVGLLHTSAVRARDRSVSLASTIEPGSVLADLDLIRRVIENLVDNALRHAPPQTEVRVSAAHRDGAAEIRVTDAGPGVAPSLRERVFDAFTQFDPDAAARSGHGLGLTFCKLAVEAHGGTIWVEEGKPGAVFCLRLPDAG